jgi:hypothetical protein
VVKAYGRDELELVPAALTTLPAVPNRKAATEDGEFALVGFACCDPIEKA